MDNNLDNISQSLNPRDWKESMKEIQKVARDLDILYNAFPRDTEEGIVIMPYETFKESQKHIKDIRNWCAKHNVDIHGG